MKMFLNIEDLVNSYVISPDPHYKFALKGYSSTFYINAFAVFIAFVTTLSIYFICIIGSMILTKIMAYYSEENLYIDNEDPELFKFIILRIIRKVQRVFLNTIHYFCSGLLRTFMSVAYEYNLAIFLQLSVRTIKNPFLSSSFFISFIFLLLQLYFIIKGFFLMSNQPYYFGQQLVKQKYGALFEGVRIRGSRPYSNYYNLLLLCKKVVFIFVLVFCYSQAYITILTCSILNIIFIFYVKSSSPLKDVYEQQKVIGGELFIWFVELLILILFYKQQNDPNEQDELIIGWFIIVLCTLLVLYQCVLDFKQHFIFLKENYLIVQNLIQKIRNYFNKPIQVHQESQAFLHQTPPQYIQYDQRKIVTFRMEY